MTKPINRRQLARYTVETEPDAMEGWTAYRLVTPEGAVYCSGRRRGSASEVQAHLRPTLGRLNYGV